MTLNMGVQTIHNHVYNKKHRWISFVAFQNALFQVYQHTLLTFLGRVHVLLGNSHQVNQVYALAGASCSWRATGTQFFRNRRIFRNVNVLSENFGLLLLVKIKVSNFIEKSLSLASPTAPVTGFLHGFS